MSDGSGIWRRVGQLRARRRTATVRLLDVLAMIFPTFERVEVIGDYRLAGPLLIANCPIGKHIFDVALPSLRVAIHYKGERTSWAPERWRAELRRFGWGLVALRDMAVAFRSDMAAVLEAAIVEEAERVVRWAEDPAWRSLLPEQARPMPLCACGCGERVRQRQSRYCQGHHLRRRPGSPTPVCRKCRCGCGQKPATGGWLPGHWRRGEGAKIRAVREAASKRQREAIASGVIENPGERAKREGTAPRGDALSEMKKAMWTSSRRRRKMVGAAGSIRQGKRRDAREELP